MRYASLRLSIVGIFALTLWSCDRTQQSPWYEPPAGLTGANGATVSLSNNPPSPGGPDGDTRLMTIDGQPVSVLYFDKVVLPPGQHTLGIEYNGAAASATVSIKATLQAGANYSAKGQRAGACDATVWLQDDSTGQAMGERLDTHLTAKPMVNGAPVFAVACN